MAVDLDFFRSETSQRLRIEGHVEQKVYDILLLLDQRGLPVPDETRARISDCRDLETLRTWFVRAITATSVEGIFTVG